MKTELATIAWTNTADGQEFSLTFDALTREVATYENTVTEHPVETGVAISDHIRPNPVRLALDGTITNAPHYLPRDHTGGAVELGTAAFVDIGGGPDSRSTVKSGVRRTAIPFTGGLLRVGPEDSAQVGINPGARALTANVLAFSVDFDRVQDAYDELVGLRDNGQLLRVVTSGRVYYNMAIVVFEASRTNAQDALLVSLQLKEVRFGDTRVVAIPPVVQPRKAKGATAPKPAKEAEQERQSVLGALAGSIGA